MDDTSEFIAFAGKCRALYSHEVRWLVVQDDGQLPNDLAGGSAQPALEPRVVSFGGSWNRALTAEERRWLDKNTGGLIGKLKRRLLGKVFEKVAQPLVDRGGGVRVEHDSGRRTLPKG